MRAALFQLTGLLRRTELESDPHPTSAHPCSSACFTGHRECRKTLRGILVPAAGMGSVLLLQRGLKQQQHLSQPRIRVPGKGNPRHAVRERSFCFLSKNLPSIFYLVLSSLRQVLEVSGLSWLSAGVFRQLRSSKRDNNVMITLSLLRIFLQNTGFLEASEIWSDDSKYVCPFADGVCHCAGWCLEQSRLRTLGSVHARTWSWTAKRMHPY